MKKMTIILLALIVMSWPSRPARSGPARLSYPATKKVDQVDDYFGTKVADPYRWLEDDNAEDVKAWVQAENAVTFGYLAKIPFRRQDQARLTEIYNYPRYSSPFRAGEHYFFYKNDGLQNQSVCYIQKGLDGTPEVFFDPNALSPGRDGPASASSASRRTTDTSRCRGARRAPTGPRSGSWKSPRRRSFRTAIRGSSSPARPGRATASTTAATTKPAPGQELKAKNEYQKVFYHKLGDPQEKDVLVWEDKEHPLRYVGAGTTEDEKFLFLTLSEGTSGTKLYIKDLTKKGATFDLLVKGFEYDSAPIEVVDGKVLVYTNEDAPNFRVVAHRSEEPGQGELADGHRREARGPERGRHGRAAASSATTSRTPTPRSISTSSTARSSARSPCPPSARRAASAASATRRSSFTPSPRSPIPRRSTSSTRPRARPRSSGRARSSSTRPPTRRSRSSTRARTGPRSRCSSSTRRG